MLTNNPNTNTPKNTKAFHADYIILKTKTLTNTQNTKQSSKQKNTFHLYVTSKYFFKPKKKKHPPKQINKHAHIIQKYIYSLD
jgi:hypothetical protein